MAANLADKVGGVHPRVEFNPLPRYDPELVVLRHGHQELPGEAGDNIGLLSPTSH